MVHSHQGCSEKGQVNGSSALYSYWATWCTLLLQTLHVAWSVCLSVCVGHIYVLRRYGWSNWDDSYGPKEHLY